MTDTIRYLRDVLHRIDGLDSAQALHKQLDELEYLHDAVGPSLVDLVDEVIGRVNERLQSLS